MTSSDMNVYNMKGQVSQAFLQKASDWLLARGIPPIAILFFLICVTIQMTILICILLRCFSQREDRESQDDYEKLGADYFLVHPKRTKRGHSSGCTTSRIPPLDHRLSRANSDPTIEARLLTKPPVTMGKFSPQPGQDRFGKTSR